MTNFHFVTAANCIQFFSLSLCIYFLGWFRSAPHSHLSMILHHTHSTLARSRHFMLIKIGNCVYAPRWLGALVSGRHISLLWLIDGWFYEFALIISLKSLKRRFSDRYWCKNLCSRGLFLASIRATHSFSLAVGVFCAHTVEERRFCTNGSMPHTIHATQIVCIGLKWWAWWSINVCINIWRSFIRVAGRRRLT